MKKNESKNFVILFGVFIVASAIRIVLNNNPYITNIIAAINIIAFWYVYYLILENAEDKFNERIANDKIIGEHTNMRKKKHFNLVLQISKWSIFLVGLIYIFIFAHAILNDIISLGALFLSIETDFAYNYVQDIFYKKK